MDEWMLEYARRRTQERVIDEVFDEYYDEIEAIWTEKPLPDRKPVGEVIDKLDDIAVSGWFHSGDDDG